MLNKSSSISVLYDILSLQQAPPHKVLETNPTSNKKTYSD